MLEPWIIEEIRRREREAEQGIPDELPLPEYEPSIEPEASPTDDRASPDQRRKCSFAAPAPIRAR